MWKSVTQYSLNAKWDISRLHSKKSVYMLSMVLSTLTQGTFQVSVNKAHLISDIQMNAYNLDLDAHDTFRRHPERFLKVLFSLNLRPLPKVGTV